ncbi:MAG: LysM peptidoglycan-binding domain-containing protein, partial [Flavobacteriales bacterium]|nr:LysM peptidoglycan-binding domain-containing protein [Flavobacteriales bacterium]
MIVEFSGAKHIKHEVQKGQTLYAVSRLYNIQVDDIKFEDDSKTVLHPGDFLYIPFDDSEVVIESTDEEAFSDSTQAEKHLTDIGEEGESESTDSTAHDSVPIHSTNSHLHTEGGEDHGGHTDTNPIFFIILSIIIGALTRHFLKKIPIPYTALLL